MGCCGCDNKASVDTAASLGVSQSIVGLVVNIYFLSIYYGRNNSPEQKFLVFRTLEYIEVIRGLLITSTILLSIWLVSSLALFMGNGSKKVFVVGQWIWTTTLIIIGDIIFPSIFICSTREILTEDKESYSKHMGFYTKFFGLLLSFVKLAVVTLGINIALCIYTKRRLREIQSQQRLVLRTTSNYGALDSSQAILDQYQATPQNPNYLEHLDYVREEHGFVQPAFAPTGAVPSASAPLPDCTIEPPPSYDQSEASLPFVQLTKKDRNY